MNVGPPFRAEHIGSLASTRQHFRDERNAISREAPRPVELSSWRESLTVEPAGSQELDGM